MLLWYFPVRKHARMNIQNTATVVRVARLIVCGGTGPDRGCKIERREERGTTSWEQLSSLKLWECEISEIAWKNK